MGPHCLLALTEITALGLTVLPLQTFGMRIVGIDVLAVSTAFRRVASATCSAGPPVLLFAVCLVLGIVLDE
jgi:hypothetical protein